MLFLGDLNTWSNKRLTVLEAMIADLDLVEVTGFPPGRRTGAGRSALTHWLLGVDATLPLDRVYTRGLIQRGARLLPYHTSDHRPLLVDLRLAGDPVYSLGDAHE